MHIDDIVTIELDVDLDPAEAVEVDTDRFPSIAAELVEAVGPGGGHPLVRFTGSRAEIIDWLAEFYLGEEPAEAAAYLAEFAE